VKAQRKALDMGKELASNVKNEPLAKLAEQQVATIAEQAIDEGDKQESDDNQIEQGEPVGPHQTGSNMPDDALRVMATNHEVEDELERPWSQHIHYCLADE
jgi:hypothetical protein